MKYKSSITLVLILIVAFFYRDALINIWRGAFHQFLPCQSPITYSIASLDTKFGVSNTSISKDLEKAEKIWELSINKDLFEYRADGSGELKINFIYDYRQKATDAMNKIGDALSNDRASYNQLKATYDSLLSEYNTEKASLDSLTDQYDSDKAAYEKEVAYWNSRGGAPKSEYEKLEQRRQSLDSQRWTINQYVDTVNSLVDQVKVAEKNLNGQVDSLNFKVNKYNSIGDSTGREFNEGEYVKDIKGARINIYQFKDESQLVRVLAHEFGHGLGLDHVNDPKAIMYYLNEGVNEKLTNSDLQILKAKCGVN